MKFNLRIHITYYYMYIYIYLLYIYIVYIFPIGITIFENPYHVELELKMPTRCACDRKDLHHLHQTYDRRTFRGGAVFTGQIK